MLIIDNISINYRVKKESVTVIKDLSLQLKEGEALVILGPSGCGKSTLINALAGIITLESGSIDYIKERNRHGLHPKTDKIGLIPQNCGLLPWKTIEENCLLPLKIRKEKISSEQRKEMTGIFEGLKILELLDKYPKKLSGGQIQRAAIARALILKPDLLLMDEPFSSLDAITREEARELFLNVWNQIKPTTILVTHSIEEALYLGSRIIVMGEHMGDVRYEMDNPYFGCLYPEDIKYLVTKKRLREQLKPQKEKEETIEPATKTM